MGVQSFDELHSLNSDNDFDSYTNEIITIYEKAEKEILAIAEKKKSKLLFGIVSLFLLSRLLNNYNSNIFRRLNNDAVQWSERAIKSSYVNGQKEVQASNTSVVNDVNKANTVKPIDKQPDSIENKVNTATSDNQISNNTINKPTQTNYPVQIKTPSNAIDKIVNQTADKLVAANNFAEKNIKEIIRQEINKAIVNKMDVKTAVTAIVDRLKKDGIKGLRDKIGRNIGLEPYVKMVAKTEQQNAYNQGIIDEALNKGIDLVLMSSHNTACPLCVPYQGRVYSITGNDKRFPLLSMPFEGLQMVIHPNCRHFLIPVSGKNADKYIKQSNRSFIIRPKDQKIIDRYNKIQKRNRKIRERVKKN